MVHTELTANDVRIPDPRQGVATVVTRYGELHAVILHPEDFMSIEEIIDTYLSRPPYELVASDAAVEAHAIVETPGAETHYDLDELDAALSE
jgi:hypothetical protein